MNWITNFVKPRLKAMVGEKPDVPDNLWMKCPGCQASIFYRDLQSQFYVCDKCGYHLRMPIEARLTLLFPDGHYKLHPQPKVPVDPLKFRDDLRYTDRLKDAQNKTKRQDSVVIAEGEIEHIPVVVALFDFSFMGGSMGTAAGEAFVAACELALHKRCALIAIPSSGGARMQEGILSLMQLPRTIIGVEWLKQAKLPYIVLLADPTTGGVTASFAMLGDIHLAEPGAMIGFAGRRVIEQTVRETLPVGFQTAEYLLAHGMVDKVVARPKQRQTLARLIGMMMRLPVAAA